MKLLHWTVFIDLLGYQQLNGAVVDIKSAKVLLNFMKSNKEILVKQTDNPKMKEFYSKPDQWDLYEHYKIDFAFISDSLIISYTPDLKKNFIKRTALLHSANALLIILQRLRVFINKCVLEKKVFIRGGISNNYSYIVESFAVGKGVGSAYFAESKQAKYPRVILADDVTKNTDLMDTINFLSNEMYNASLIKKDEDDGVNYLDFNSFGRVSLDAKSKNKFIITSALKYPDQYKHIFYKELKILKTYKNAIEFQIKKALTLKKSQVEIEKKLFNSLREKYLWLSKYHNDSCESFHKLEIPTSDYQKFSTLQKDIPKFLLYKIDNELKRLLEN